MDNDFFFDLITVLDKHNISRPNLLRNIMLRNDYKELRATGVKGKDVKTMLENKYFIGRKTIDKILYGKESFY